MYRIVTGMKAINCSTLDEDLFNVIEVGVAARKMLLAK